MHTTLIRAFALVLAMTATSVGARTIIQNKGSDTLVNVAQAWAESYQNVNADVAVAVSGGGSGTGIAAMINGTVDIANASRQMKQKEVDQAKSRGQDPMEHIVGYDALAVVPAPAQPPRLDQHPPARRDLRRRRARPRTGGISASRYPAAQDQEIVLVSRQNNSGTYAYFRKAVLGGKRDYKLGTRDMHGSKDVVHLVETTPCAIGYSGLAYANEHVKMPCVATEDGAACVSPSVATASDGSYPVARPLYMYTNGEPQGEVKSYLDWILSDEGQCIISDKGYAPVRAIRCN